MKVDKAARTRNMRFKRPALASLGYEIISNELYEINNACTEVQWFVESDNETLLNALNGDEDAEYEFRMAFADLQAKTETLSEELNNWEIRDDFDDCTVGLIGNRYKTLGFDQIEEDYFGLTSYEQGLAYTESGKKLMRLTKPEMISRIGQCLGITIAYLDIRQSYDYLKAVFDILRDENTSLLKIIKDIEEAYEEAVMDGFAIHHDKTRRFDALISNLPDRTWLEC
jgi:hypothetical protein